MCLFALLTACFDALMIFSQNYPNEWSLCLKQENKKTNIDIMKNRAIKNGIFKTNEKRK